MWQHIKYNIVIAGAVSTSINFNLINIRNLINFSILKQKFFYLGEKFQTAPIYAHHTFMQTIVVK